MNRLTSDVVLKKIRLERQAVRLCGVLLLLCSLPSSVFSTQSATAPDPDHRETLWVGQENRLLKLDVESRDTFHIVSGEAKALAIDGTRETVWAYGNNTLVSYGFDEQESGSFRVEEEYAGAHDTQDKADLAVDPETGIVWLGVGKSVYSFSSYGEIREVLSLEAPVVGLELDAVHQKIWIATERAVIAFELSLVESFRLDLPSGSELKALTVDPLDGSIWVAGEDAIRHFEANGSQIARLRIRHASHLVANGRGGLWVAKDDRLGLIDANSGSVLRVFRPFGRYVDIDALELQAGTGQVWAAGRHSARRIAPHGDADATFFTYGDIVALGHYRDQTPPRISIESPDDQAPVGTLYPEISVAYEDLAIGVKAETLHIELDGEALDLECQFSSDSAVCLPEEGLPEGSHTLTANVGDYAGNLSESDEVFFRISTDTDGDGLNASEELALGTDPEVADTDGDGKLDGAEVGDVENPRDSDMDGVIDALESSTDDSDSDGIPDETDAFVNVEPGFETGEVSISGTVDEEVWKTVDLGRVYNNPVVIAGPVSHRNELSLSARIRHVTNDSFQIGVQSPCENDGEFAGAGSCPPDGWIKETIQYLVVEEGVWRFPDGRLLQAGLRDTNLVRSRINSKPRGERVEFARRFNSPPVVLHTVNTTNDAEWVGSSVWSRFSGIGREPDERGFSAALEGGEVTWFHGTERIGWVAIESGSGWNEGNRYFAGHSEGRSTSRHDVACRPFGEFDYDGLPNVVASTNTTVGRNGSWVRLCDAGIASNEFYLHLDEDQVWDAERRGFEEQVSWFAYPGHEEGRLVEDVVAAYQLEEGVWNGRADEVRDSSGNGLDGRAVNGTHASSEEPALTGEYGTCGYAEFDSSLQQFIVVGDDPQLDFEQSLTGSIWFYLDALPENGRRTILSKNDNFEIHVDSRGEVVWRWKQWQKLFFFWWPVSKTLSTSDVKLSEGRWYHVAVTFDANGRQALFIDGVKRRQSFHYGELLSGADPLYIGRDHGGADRYFDGRIDEIRLYDRTFSRPDVDALFERRHACAGTDGGDTQAPVVTAPADVVVEATGLETPVELGTASATDDRDGELEATADVTGPFALGEHVVMWSATDSAGNTGTATQRVTVQDTTAPALTVPADVEVESAEPLSVDLGTASATDIFTPVEVTNDAPALFDLGVTPVAWSATDANGNTSTATQQVTVSEPADTQAPVVTAPADVVVEATAVDTPVELGTASATDDRDGELEATADVTGPFALGEHVVTWSATDSAGNTGTATQRVTVQDTTAPALTVPADVEVESAEPLSVDLGTASATDIFTPVEITNDAPALFGLGVTEVTWSATDANGNTSTATQQVTVSEQAAEGPTLDPGAATTENNPFSVSGNTNPNVEVRLYVNGNRQQATTSSASGEFSFGAYLFDGTNTIQTTFFSNGAESGFSNTLTVTYTNNIPREQGGNSISTDTVWTPGSPAQPYTISGSDLMVGDNAKLVLQPGVELRLGDGVQLDAQGVLLILGTEDNKVLFTADSASPQKGDWWRIHLGQNRPHEVRHAIVEYAERALSFSNTDVHISNSIFRHNEEYGVIFGHTTEGSITNSTITDSGIGVAALVEASPVIENNVVSENNTGILVKGLVIPDATISTPTIRSNEILDNSDTGIHIKELGNPTVVDNTVANNYYGFFLEGLRTTYRQGGEVLDIDPKPAIGDNSIVDNSIAMYTRRFLDDTLTFVDARNNWWGSTDPVVIADSIYDRTGGSSRAPVVDFSAFLDGPIPEGVPVPERHLYAVPDDLELDAGETYTMLGDVRISEDTTLTIPEGVRIQAPAYYRIRADGGISVNGTEANPVLLTSARDVPNPRDWEGISIVSANADNSIRHMIVEYARDGIIVTGNANIDYATIRSNDADGITFESNSSGRVSNSHVHGNAAGIRIEDVDASIPITNSVIEDNDTGIYLVASHASIVGNDIESNGIGIQAFGRNDTLGPPVANGNTIAGNTEWNYRATDSGNAGSRWDATGNWWGTTDTTAISASLYDFEDNPGGSPILDFGGFLDGLDGEPAGVNQLFGFISTDTVLDTDTRYELVGDLTVLNGATLTIPEGVTVEATEDFQITVEGELAATGAPGNTVFFRPRQGPFEKSAWQGIKVADGGVLDLSNAVVEYAERGVWFQNATGTVTNSLIQHNIYGVYIEGNSTPTLNGDTIVFNDYGIYLAGTGNDATNPNPVITGNDIYNNDIAQLFAEGFGAASVRSIDATDNWWGTASPEIGTELQFQDTPSSVIDFSDPRSQPGQAPVLTSLNVTPPFFSPNADGSQDQVNLTGTLTAAADWRVVIVGPGGTVASQTGTGQTVSISWDGTDSVGGFVPDGTYILFIDVTAGGTTHRRGSVRVVADTNAPQMTVPADISVEATAVQTPVDLGTVTASDPEYGALTPEPSETGPFGVGAFDILWTAQDRAGNLVSQLQTVVVTDTTPPELSVPEDIVVESEAPVSVDIGEATATDIFEVIVENDAPAQFPVDATTDVTWTATDANGNETTAVQQVTVNAPPEIILTLTSPTDGANIDVPTVLVSGTVEAPPNTGVLVNGQLAAVDRTQTPAVFHANVPLTAGVNTITVAGTTHSGDTASETVTVTRIGDPDSPFDVAATPTEGIAPLEVTFGVSQPDASGSPDPSNTVFTLDFDFDGDGNVDLSQSDFQIIDSQPVFTPLTLEPVTHTYDTPGVYLATVTINNLNAIDPTFNEPGVTFTIPIEILDVGSLDLLLTSIWEGMHTALLAGDLPTALGYLSPGAQRKYEPVFQALLPHFPQITDSYTSWQRTEVNPTYAEFALNRTIEERDHVFLIYFARDVNGVWRLVSM